MNAEQANRVRGDRKILLSLFRFAEGTVLQTQLFPVLYQPEDILASRAAGDNYPGGIIVKNFSLVERVFAADRGFNIVHGAGVVHQITAGLRDDIGPFVFYQSNNVFFNADTLPLCQLLGFL